MDEPVPAGDGAGEQDQPGDSPEYRGRLEHFIALLLDDDAASRWKAAEALGRLGDPAAVGDLIDTLWDDDERVRVKAVWALGEIGDDRAIPPLRRLYRMERDEMRERIEEAIALIGRQMHGL